MQSSQFWLKRNTCSDTPNLQAETINDEFERRLNPEPEHINARLPDHISYVHECNSCDRKCPDYLFGAHNAKIAADAGMTKFILSNKFFCFTYPLHIPSDILKKIYHQVFESDQVVTIIYWSVHYELGHSTCNTNICKNSHTHLMLECDPRFRKRITNQLDVTVSDSEGNIKTISPVIDVYPTRSLFNHRRNMISEKELHQTTLIIGWTDALGYLLKADNGASLKFKLVNADIMIPPCRFYNKFVSIDQSIFRVNLIEDLTGKLFDTLLEDDKFFSEDDKDTMGIRGRDDHEISMKVERAIINKEWTGKYLIIGKYEHGSNTYIVNTLAILFGKMLSNGLNVPDIKSIWIFSTTPITVMIDDDDGHYPYNIYGVNLTRNKLVQITN